MSRSSRVRRTNSCWRSMVAIVASGRDGGVTWPPACPLGAIVPTSLPGGSPPGRDRSADGGRTGLPVGPALVPVAEAVPDLQRGPRVGDLDDVAVAEVVVEPAG